MSHDRKPFKPFSLKGLVRNSQQLSPAIHSNGKEIRNANPTNSQSWHPINNLTARGTATNAANTKQIAPNLSNASIFNYLTRKQCPASRGIRLAG